MSEAIRPSAGKHYSDMNEVPVRGMTIIRGVLAHGRLHMAMNELYAAKFESLTTHILFLNTIPRNTMG